MGNFILCGNNNDMVFDGKTIVSDDPIWAEKDSEISSRLFNLFMEVTEKAKLTDVHFSIAEKSDDEVDPHYLIDATTGDVSEDGIYSTIINIEYIAKLEEESHFGAISLLIEFGGTESEREFIGRILLEEYMALLGFYYPEFETTYFEPDIEEKWIPYQYLLKNSE